MEDEINKNKTNINLEKFCIICKVVNLHKKRAKLN